jgi:hypothetical protein
MMDGDGAPDITQILEKILDNAAKKGATTAETAVVCGDMMKSFSATYNASYVEVVVAKQLAEALTASDSIPRSREESKAKNDEDSNKARSRIQKKQKALDIRDDGVPKGASFFLVKTLLKQLISLELGCHLPWAQIPVVEKRWVEGEIQMSFKNGAYISAEWLKRQMQSIMNHQRSYRRRLMQDCLSDMAANEEPVRPPTISKEFWDFHIRAKIARSAWLGLYLAEKDLASRNADDGGKGHNTNNA